jgi:hypothetical protein
MLAPLDYTTRCPSCGSHAHSVLQLQETTPGWQAYPCRVHPPPTDRFEIQPQAGMGYGLWLKAGAVVRKGEFFSACGFWMQQPETHPYAMARRADELSYIPCVKFIFNYCNHEAGAKALVFKVIGYKPGIEAKATLIGPRWVMMDYGTTHAPFMFATHLFATRIAQGRE